MATGRIREPVLAASVAGPGRQRRPGVEQADRDAVAAIAPVDEQAEHLAAPEHAEDRAQVAPRDERERPTPRAARRSSSNSSGNDESSATTLIGKPWLAIAGGDRLVVADVTAAEDEPAARRLAPDPPDSTSLLDRGPRRGGRPRRPAATAGASARRGSGRSRGRRAARAGGPAGRPAAARGRARSLRSTSVASPARRGTRPGPGGRPPTPAGPAGRTPQEPRRRPVGEDADPLDDPRPVAAPRRCGASSRRSRGGHRAAAATLALVPASRLTVFLTGASVPTSVSLSSPRMNASTRLNAMSSWIWIGGLFMK